MRSLLLTLVCLAIVASAEGQQPITVTFEPAVPTSTSVIIAHLSIPEACGLADITTAITGTTIRTDLAALPCVVGLPPPPATVAVTFGPLPAGTYTYEVNAYTYEGYPPRTAQQPLVVVAPAATDVPALDAWWLAFLAIALAGLGWVHCCGVPPRWV